MVLVKTVKSIQEVFKSFSAGLMTAKKIKLFWRMDHVKTVHPILWQRMTIDNATEEYAQTTKSHQLTVFVKIVPIILQFPSKKTNAYFQNATIMRLFLQMVAVRSVLTFQGQWVMGFIADMKAVLISR